MATKALPLVKRLVEYSNRWLDCPAELPKHVGSFRPKIYPASGAAGKLPRRSKNNPWAGRSLHMLADQIGAAGWCPEATLCNDTLIVYNC